MRGLLLLIFSFGPVQTANKPPPELDALAKIWVGSWTCQNVGKQGNAQARYTNNITWTGDPDGFWLAGHRPTPAA